MRLRTIFEFVEPEILSADQEDWEAADQAERIANDSGIRIARNKELTLIARVGDDIVGAVWSAFELDSEASQDHGEDVYHFDFDVAVDSKSRAIGMASARIGPKLIDAALEYYQTLKSEFGNVYIRVWVVNQKLAGYLERRYGFEPEGREWSPNSPHMIYRE